MPSLQYLIRPRAYVLLVGATAAAGAMLNPTLAKGIGAFTGAVAVLDVVQRRRHRDDDR